MAAQTIKTNLPSIRELSRDFISLFFPNYCLGCSRPLVKGEEILCTYCLSELPKTGYHLVDDNPVKRRFAGRINLNHGWAYLQFRKTGIVQHLIHQLKYNNQPEIGIRLGKTFGTDLKFYGFEKEFDLIVPVPLHKTKHKKRGYNQSEKFAKGLSESFGIPVLEGVSIKLIHTETQTRKSRMDRWENVKQSFDILSKEKLFGKKILLVDDVITTGATLEACGQKIIDCGCTSLSIACLAEAQ